MQGIFYFKTANDEIYCINCYGRKYEKINEFIVDNFSVEEDIIRVSLSRDNKRILIKLESKAVLIFDDINMLLNKKFRSLLKYNKVKVAYFKHKIKNKTKNAKAVLCKELDPKKISVLSTATAILLANAITVKAGTSRTETFNNKVVIEENIDNKTDITSNLNSYKKIESPKVEKPSEIKVIKEEEKVPLNDNNLTTSEPEAHVYNIKNDDSTVSYDDITQAEQIQSAFDYYEGDEYNYYSNLMNDYYVTEELNRKINSYINNNLSDVMWGNAYNQGYNDYTIPEKYKNGTFTLNELFDDVSNTFGVPKDILVSISEHECSQSYYLKNSYTGIYEKNCGGMMGHINLYEMSSDHLPNGGYDGCDVATNPALSIYSYASAVKFFYDNFKDIDLGYGFDSWDLSSYMVAIGQGYVSDYAVGFKYRYDFDESGVSQLNICAPQFKVLRNAYLNNTLGVNDLTFTAENGYITHWSDGDKFYYKNGEYTFSKMDNSSKRY